MCEPRSHNASLPPPRFTPAPPPPPHRTQTDSYQHAAPITQHRYSMASYSKSRRATGSSNATTTSALNIADSSPHASSRNALASRAAGVGGTDTEDIDLVATFAAHIMERDRGVAPGSPRRPAVQTYFHPRLGSREVSVEQGGRE